MIDFEVQRCARQCAKTSREFAPGELYYSALVAEQGDVVRRDYCAAAWQGPPEGALGWWKSQVPTPDSKKVHWAPNDVLLHYFEQLDGVVDKADTRYILALLMVRRRVFRLEHSEHDEAGRERLVVHCPRNETEYRVEVVTPDARRVGEIQEELAQLLQTDAK